MSIRNIAEIELKSADDADPNELVTKALEGLTADVNGKLAKVTNDLAAIQARMNRPGAANDNHANDNSLEAKAFNDFVRRGPERLSADELKTMTVATDAAGGFLAPEAFGNEILKSLRQFSPIRQYARVVSIGAPEVKYPRRTSSTTATWVSEVADRTESELTYEQVTLTPYELATYVDVSTQLLEDNAYNLEGELGRDLGESFAIAEGLAFAKGNGAGKPKGLFSATGMAEIKTGYLGPAKDWANYSKVLMDMFHALPGPIAQNGVWIMNRKTLGDFRNLTDGLGRLLAVEFLTDGLVQTFLGRPIVEAVDAPDIADGACPVIFGDLQAYRIVDRVGLSILRDPYTLASKGQVRIHARRRVGGDVTDVSRFVKLKVAV